MKNVITCIVLFALCLTTSSPVFSQKIEKAKSEKTQCIATTQKGTRCKLEAVKGHKYCKVHMGNDSSVEKCKATTQKGTRCTRAAKVNGYCTQHSKNK